MYDKSAYAEIIKESEADKNSPPLPYMSPDLLDDFITWLYERVDLLSFKRSSAVYKYRMYKQWRKTLQGKQLELAITSYETRQPRNT